MLAKVKDATWSSPKIVGHSRSWSTISSKDRGQTKLYLKIANSEDHFSIKIVTETILSQNGLESHKIVTKIVPEDRDHAPFFDSRWSSVTRSWAKVVVLHKILIKIVRQNVPMIFATILVKTVLKIVSVVASIPVLIFSTRGWISLYVDVIGGSTVACWIWLATWIRLELIGSIPLRAQISLFNYLHSDWPR